MAKVAKPKSTNVSVHSRAARRGGSPTADLNVKAPVEETDYKPWIHNTQNAGITKKKKTKPLTRQQRERHEKGLANAERNLDKHEKKVAGSKARARRVDERRAAWEDLNKELAAPAEADTKKTSKTTKAIVKDSGKAQPMDGIDMAELAPVKVGKDNSLVIEKPVDAIARDDEIDEIT